MARFFQLAKVVAERTNVHSTVLINSQPTRFVQTKREPQTAHPISTGQKPDLSSACKTRGKAELPAKNHPRLTKKRRKTTYTENYSAALSLPYTFEELQKNQNDEKAILNLAKQQIIEHSSRRVDLFLYTLIAYYKTGYLPSLGRTALQHGRGRSLDRYTNLTEACHSSFTPTLLDNSRLSAPLGQLPGSLLSGTHFMDSLNSTVELPGFVNALDNFLEEKCRSKSIEILDLVAIGKLDPVKGLTCFLQMMQGALDELQELGELQGKSTGLTLFDHPKHLVNLDVLDLIRRGTLRKTFTEETKSASDDYIQLMLRLTAEEKAECEKSPAHKNTMYARKVLELQTEILETKSTYTQEELEKKCRRAE